MDYLKINLGMKKEKYLFDELQKRERRKTNARLFKYYLKQKTIGLLLILCTIAFVFLLRDITPAFVLFPLGVWIFITPEPLMDFKDKYFAEQIYNRKRNN